MVNTPAEHLSTEHVIWGKFLNFYHGGSWVPLGRVGPGGEDGGPPTEKTSSASNLSGRQVPYCYWSLQGEAEDGVMVLGTQGFLCSHRDHRHRLHPLAQLS